MTGIGAPAEKAQPDAHRSPWQGSRHWPVDRAVTWLDRCLCGCPGV